MTVLEPSAPTGADDAGADDPRTPFALRARATFLRDVAVDVEPILAMSIRRRASELELAAWVLEVRAGV